MKDKYITKFDRLNIFQIIYLKYLYIYYSLNLAFSIILFRKIIFNYIKLSYKLNTLYFINKLRCISDFNFIENNYYCKKYKIILNLIYF